MLLDFEAATSIVNLVGLLLMLLLLILGSLGVFLKQTSDTHWLTGLFLHYKGKQAVIMGYFYFLLAIISFFILLNLNHGNIVKIFSFSSLYKKDPYCNLENSKKPQDLNDKEKVKTYRDCKPFYAVLKNQVTEDQIKNTIEGLKRLKVVYHIDYIPREDAQREYKEFAAKENPLLSELAPKDNFLPNKVRIFVSTPALRESILDVAKSKTTI